MASNTNLRTSWGFLLAFISFTLAASKESTAAWALACAGSAAANYLSASVFCWSIAMAYL